MAKDYLRDKAVKKKSATKASWLIILFILIFAVLLGKFAMSDGTAAVFNGLPSSDDAYRVARQFIQPTIRSPTVTFEDSEYKYAKKGDSVYVIKSAYVEKMDDGETARTNFTITLKYNGGQAVKQSNWTMMNLDQDN